MRLNTKSQQLKSNKKSRQSKYLSLQVGSFTGVSRKFPINADVNFLVIATMKDQTCDQGEEYFLV